MKYAGESASQQEKNQEEEEECDGQDQRNSLGSVIDGESEGGDCDEVTRRMRWTRRRVNRIRLTEWRKEADSTGEVMHI